jgi:flagellar motility protein MotE (MotC chaperone)
MREISERVAQGESFLITKNSDVIFEIRPKMKKNDLPIVSDKAQVIKILQNQIDEKLAEIAELNQHIKMLLDE